MSRLSPVLDRLDQNLDQSLERLFGLLAIKSISTERGRDPHEFALFAFGGNGPLFACGMAAADR